MSPSDVDQAWLAMWRRLDSLEDLDATWLNVATILLSFCAKSPPSANAWKGLAAGEPLAAILAVEASATSDLMAVDPRLFAPPADDDESDDTFVFSHASPQQIDALHQRAERELSRTLLQDPRLAQVTIARGLAGAIDNLVGRTYVGWFKNLGEIQLTEGEAYPVHPHDPRPWLGEHAANTNPTNLPTRDLAWTRRLRIAGASYFNYIIDFEMWNRLSPIGAESGLVIAVAQPNFHFGEFDIRKYSDRRPTYANRGPADREEQTRRIKRLIDSATGKGAEIIVMPEYSLSEDVCDDICQHVSRQSERPLLLCAGVSGSPDGDDYVGNEAWLLAVTPGMERSYSPRSQAKIYGATVDGMDERIRGASEIRVFMCEHWTLATLICRDSMDRDILHQLAIMGTNLVLVPAMSQKTATMVGVASQLCHTSQAFVAMANGPAAWQLPATANRPPDTLNQTFAQPVNQSAAPSRGPERCEAFFAGPYASNPATFFLPPPYDPRSTEELGLWLYVAADQAVAAIPIP